LLCNSYHSYSDKTIIQGYIMAANISNGAQRFDHARTERDDENNAGDPAAPDVQTPPQPSETSITTPTEQQDQSSGDGGGSEPGSHNSATPAPLPEEVVPVPFPAQFRYGLGDTVIMGAPSYVRDYALTPQLRAEHAETEISFTAPSSPTTTSAKPIPLSKPGGTFAPDVAGTLESLPSPAPITNAPANGGQIFTSNNPDTPTNLESLPSNRQPYPTPGLHTAPEQSPHYANALAYGREHGYKDDEIMKLAVLMQNNGDASLGREWLSLKPDVLRSAVNAVVRIADNSFDTSGVFGGRAGYPDVAFISQRIPADAQTAAYGSSNDNVAQGTYPKPEGWVMVEETVGGSNGDGGDTTTTLRYYCPGDEMMMARSGASPLLSALGYTQVQHGAESELSVGAAGGYRDLSRLTFHPDFGLVTTPDNYIPFQTRDDVGGAIMGVMAVGFMAITGVPANAYVAGGATVTESAIYAGAINGAVGSMVLTGATGGEVTFKGILQGALTGGILGGLSTVPQYQNLQSLGLDPKNPNIVTSYALRAVSITGQATVQGALRELVGGHFRDGFTQGIAQGLAGEITRALNGDIAGRLARQEITPEQARVLNQMSTLTGSAIRAAVNPNDPAYAFAQDYLQQLFGTGGKPAEGSENTDTGGLVINVTTRSSVTGSEIGDQLFGALQGTASVGMDIVRGAVDIAAMSRDGYEAIINLVAENTFPDATTRNADRENTLNHVMANIDKLPAAVIDGFNADLDHATQLDASNNPADRVEAARLRSHALGGAVLAALTLGETAVGAASGAIRAISNLAEARLAVGEILEQTSVGLRARQTGSIDVAAMLDGGRVLVRSGTDLFEAEFRAMAEGAGRQLVLLRPVTDLIDEASRTQLRYAPESMAPENLARINRAIDALTPQRFQQLTERYAELVNSDKYWSWADDIDPGLARSQQEAIRRAAIEGGLLPDVPYFPGTLTADFNAIPGLVHDVRILPRELWGIPEGQQYIYLDNLIGGRPAGYTWHHSEVAGRMELIPYGIHRLYPHEGGCSPGQWSFGSRK
jgi:hypothetical protein